MRFCKTTSLFIILIALIGISKAQAQGPEVSSWVLNLTGDKGYQNIPSNVQSVQYSHDWVYVSASCIPGYDIGPWPTNPNTPKNQNFVFKITRHPEKNSGTPVETPLGHIGVWSNGVSIFNAKDARSYNNADIWHQNALAVEGLSFDSCLGHPAPNGEYHHHVNPRCLYDYLDGTKHSPIIGYAFDGYPIYGAYGYANTDGTGGVKRVQSSYRLRAITDRTTLAGGTQLSLDQQGPSISQQYPLGYYLEDFEYVQGLGDLDEHNGRFCVTPEYPQGTYAYFVTLDEQLLPAFPYTLGSTYYGVITPGNTGPTSGHNTISETVTTYTPQASVDFPQAASFATKVYPNPASNYLSFIISNTIQNNFKVELLDALGRTLYTQQNVQPTIQYTLDLAHVTKGIYYLRAETSFVKTTSKIIINK